MGLNADKRILDTAALADSDNIGAYLRASDGTLLTHTDVGGKKSLDVYLANASDIVVAVDLDGIYSGGNTDPDNVGLISHVRAASPADTDQTVRTTAGAASADAVVAANVHGMDVNAFGMGFNGTTWDRLTSSSGALDVNLASQDADIAIDISDLVADDAVDAGGSLKVGSRALSGALAAVSATGDRADLISDLYRRIWVNDSANVGLASAASAITTTEAALPALAGRKSVILQNVGSQDAYIGPTGLTAADGLLLRKGSSLEIAAGPNIALYALTSTGSTEIRVFELA